MSKLSKKVTDNIEFGLYIENSKNIAGSADGVSVGQYDDGSFYMKYYNGLGTVGTGFDFNTQTELEAKMKEIEPLSKWRLINSQANLM